MSVDEHFLVPEEQQRENVAKDMARSMDDYMEVAIELERKARMLNVLPDHDAEGLAVKSMLFEQAAVFRRAAKETARHTWKEHDRSANEEEI